MPKLWKVGQEIPFPCSSVHTELGQVSSFVFKCIQEYSDSEKLREFAHSCGGTKYTDYSHYKFWLVEQGYLSYDRFEYPLHEDNPLVINNIVLKSVFRSLEEHNKLRKKHPEFSIHQQIHKSLKGVTK